MCEYGDPIRELSIFLELTEKLILFYELELFDIFLTLSYDLMLSLFFYISIFLSYKDNTFNFLINF